jgi:hypothetical protein
MSLDLIKLEHNLLNDFTKSNIKDKILNRVSELKLENIGKYKNDIQFLKLVCQLIEHLVLKKDHVKKLDLCIEIYKQLFPDMSPDEVKLLESNVNYLCNNSNIKKVSYYKLFKTGFLEFFKRDHKK